MINDFIKWCLDLIDTFYDLIPSEYNLIEKITDLINSISSYQSTWNDLTSVIFAPLIATTSVPTTC